jgi:phage-related protein
MEFVDNFLDAINDIFDFVISAVDGLIDFIILVPSTLAEAIEAAGSVITIFTAMFNNLPQKLWLGIFLYFTAKMIVYFFSGDK